MFFWKQKKPKIFLLELMRKLKVVLNKNLQYLVAVYKYIF